MANSPFIFGPDGSIFIGQPLPTTGQVLTAVDNIGNLDWQTPGGSGGYTTFNFANDVGTFSDVTGFLVTSTTAFQAQCSILRVGTTNSLMDAEDTAFYTNLGSAFSNSVLALAVQANQQVLVGGAFTTFNGNTRDYIVRLNTDGTEDTSFYTNLGTGFGTGGSTITALAVQANQQILVGGSFSTLNGNTRNGLVRLNSDGTEDTTFATNIGTGFLQSGLSPIIQTICVQTNGQILVGGNFNTFNGNTRNNIVRLNSDGIEDTTFATNIGTAFAGGSGPFAMIQQITSGDIVVGGNFTSFNGTTVYYLIGLNTDGTLNTSFNTNVGTGPGAIVLALVQQANGQIVVGGDFTSFGSYSPGYIIRINASGLVDTSFQPLTPSTGYNGQVNALAIQSDQNIVVGGQFTTLNDGSGSVTQDYISRLMTTGLQDSTFYTSFGSSFNTNVYALAVQSNDQILIGGGFTTENSNTRNRLVRWETSVSNPYSAVLILNIDGVYDPTTSAWILGLNDTVGQPTGIAVQMEASGQLQYTSTDLATQTTGTMRFIITEL